MANDLQLSTLEPDFAAIRLQLQNNLSSREAWRGILPTQTGQTLIDFVAAVGALTQGRALRYAQDSFPETAIANRALYAISEMQGIRLTRKAGATAQVSVSYESSVPNAPSEVTIPAYAQFQAAGTYWFAPDIIVVPLGGSVTSVLKQGYVIETAVAGTGGDFQSFISTDRDFSVDDTSTTVLVNNVPLEKSVDGLWNYRNVSAYQERTTPEGQLRVLFGNETFGYRPQTTDIVRIIYAVTSGSDGNNVVTLDAAASPVAVTYDGVSFVFTSNPSGGSNEPPGTTLKGVSSTNFGTFGSAVTKSQYVTMARGYPGVIDVKTYAQREIDPTDRSLMNTIRIVPLTESLFTEQQKTAFLDYMQSKSMYTPIMYWSDPLRLIADVEFSIYCYNFANLQECRASATAAIQKLFAPQSGILGYDITISDLHKAALNSNPGIEYVDFFKPLDDLNVSGREIDLPTVSLVTTGLASTLLTGTYTYGIGVTVAGVGMAVPTKFVEASIVAGVKIKLDWYPYGYSTGYTIYGRSALSGLFKLVDLPATTTTFTDDGSLLTATPMPTNRYFPAAYNSLGNLKINAFYSPRVR